MCRLPPSDLVSEVAHLRCIVAGESDDTNIYSHIILHSSPRKSSMLQIEVQAETRQTQKTSLCFFFNVLFYLFIV
jgi:hypothetical protein